MFIKKLQDCDEFVAGDNSLLRELLHPSKANLAIRYSLAHAVVKRGQYVLNTGSSELKFLCIVDILHGIARMKKYCSF